MKSNRFKGRYGRRIQVDVGQHGVIVRVTDRKEKQVMYLYMEEIREVVDWLKEAKVL